MVAGPAAINDWHYQKKTNKKKKYVAAYHKGLPAVGVQAELQKYLAYLNFLGSQVRK
jgi:hypothetical protein